MRARRLTAGLAQDLDNEHALDRSKSLDSPLYPLYWVEAGLEGLARIKKESAGMQSEVRIMCMGEREWLTGSLCAGDREGLGRVD